MAHPDLPIILLAAGAATRMRGRDKLLERVDGQTLVRLQALRARACTAGPVIVTLPPPPHPRYDALADLNITPLPIPDANEGMAASLRTAVTALPRTAKRVMVLLADMPELTEIDLKTTLQAADKYPENLIWRGATTDGKPGHPILFDAALFDSLRALSGDRGARDIVASAGPKVHLVALPGNRARLDLDTPEDWANWRAGRDLL